MSFSSSLQTRVERFGPLVLGLDPSANLLQSSALKDSADGALALAQRVLEATRGELAMVKPQLAYFERFGGAGLLVLERIAKEFRSAGVLVLMDGKRGDIDATARAYAEAYLDPASPLAADAVTVHAYLGLDALAPFFELAQLHHRGVFVVVRSSNPEASRLQAAQIDGMSVAALLSQEIGVWNRRLCAQEWLGPIGAVVGATLDDVAATAAALPHSWLLAPGVGAQGATFDDVKRRFGTAVNRVLPSVSRALFQSGATQAKLRETYLRMREQSAN